MFVLTFNVCACVDASVYTCVCVVCVLTSYVRACVEASVYICVRVYVCLCLRLTYVRVLLRLCIYVCVCMCACMYVCKHVSRRPGQAGALTRSSFRCKPLLIHLPGEIKTMPS
jgi:hypothetical protein